MLQDLYQTRKRGSFSSPIHQEVYLMTNNEKDLIRKLCKQGLGYEKISADLGISLNTVKFFVAHNSID